MVLASPQWQEILLSIVAKTAIEASAKCHQSHMTNVNEPDPVHA
jgi:hypothetical protein